MSAASPLRIGIVGLGAAGRAFLPAIKKHSGFELVGVAAGYVAVGVFLKIRGNLGKGEG